MALCVRRNMNYLKKYGWFVVGTPIILLVAYNDWSDFITKGYIHDFKHELIFYGEDAYGHLLGETVMAAVLTYYLGKSIYTRCRRQ